MNKQNRNEYIKLFQKKKYNITNLKISSKRAENESLKNSPKIDNKTFSYILNKNDSYTKNNKSNNDFSSQLGNSILISNISPDLEWNNYKSIYEYLISYINLMIVNLNKDNNKLCKYLKEIFLAIFTISQKTKNFYKTIKTSNIHNADKHNDNNIKTNNSTHIGEWNFITGEITSNNNNAIVEDLFEKEKNNETWRDFNNKDKNNNREIISLTQRENNLNEKNLEISFLQEKIEKLNKYFKKKEKQFQIDKLKYLFRINEQNILIRQLENKIKINNLNNLSEKNIKEMKCFPDYKKEQNNEEIIIENEKNKKIKKCFHNSIINERKEYYLSHPKLHFDDISIFGKNCHNIEDIINKNFFKLKNKGKLNKYNLKKFLSLSLSETKINIDKIINKK